MIHFFDISIPVATARDLAIRTDDRTAFDDGYVVKSAFAEAFGHGTIRPWRRIGKVGSVYRVLGIVTEPKALRANDASRRLGIVTDRIEFEFGRDAFIRFDLLATPIKHVPVKDAEGVKRHTFPSVAVEKVLQNDPSLPARYVETDDPEVRTLKYQRWIFEQVMREGRGLEIASVPEIQSMRPVRHLMKLGGRVSSVLLPAVHAQFDAVVREPEAAMAFFREGLKKRKDLGMGGIFPLQVMQEIQS